MNLEERQPLPGGDLEFALLRALWRRKTATARELYEEIGAPRAIVYTTVAKVLDRLVDKRMVRPVFEAYLALDDCRPLGKRAVRMPAEQDSNRTGPFKGRDLACSLTNVGNALSQKGVSSALLQRAFGRDKPAAR